MCADFAAQLLQKRLDSKEPRALISALLRLERKIFQPEQLGKFVLAAWLITAVFVSLLLSASPSLHEQFHPDAAQASHQCAITIFQQQQLLASNPVLIIVELNPGLSRQIDFSECVLFSDRNYNFSASRAPPFLFAPLA